MNSDKNVESQIIEMFNSYAKAYTNKDLDTLSNLFLKDSKIVAIGTGEDEWVHGFNELKEGFKRDINQSESIDIEFDNITISSIGNAAWSSSFMNMYAKVSDEEIILHGRLTAVFEKIEDEWFFVHLHYSLPAESQEKGQSFPK